MCDEELGLKYITGLIRRGFHTGYHPYWSLDATHDVLSSDEHMEYIADLVEQGFTSGYYPTWSIEIGD